MIEFERIRNAEDLLIENWGEQGKRVIEVCHASIPFEGEDTRVFMGACQACGNNWSGMLLTGIKKLWPAVWEVIPEHLGDNGWHSFFTVCAVLTLLNVDTSK